MRWKQMRIATQMMRRKQIRKEPRKMSRIQNWNVMQKNQAKTKKHVDKSDGNSERTFGKPGRDSEKPRENAPVTAGKSSGISHANLEEATKENATTPVEKLRQDSSAITGKARKKNAGK